MEELVRGLAEKVAVLTTDMAWVKTILFMLLGGSIINIGAVSLALWQIRKNGNSKKGP